MSGGPRVWLNASTATIYRHSLDREMDEAAGELGGHEPGAPGTWGFSIAVARQWEESFFRSPQVPRTRKICLRTAMVMAAESGGVFEAVLRLVGMGLGGAWGSGRQYMSWIHEADFARAVEFLIRGNHGVG
jgi:NAD dependent epimerase/dehydratase family enzyme